MLLARETRGAVPARRRGALGGAGAIADTAERSSSRGAGVIVGKAARWPAGPVEHRRSLEYLARFAALVVLDFQLREAVVPAVVRKFWEFSPQNLAYTSLAFADEAVFPCRRLSVSRSSL